MLSNNSGSKSRINLSIIIPVYNEEKRIGVAFREVGDFIIHKSAEYNLEIIFVNDGSSDNTKSAIEKYTENKNGIIKLISYSVNKGKGYAVRQGMLAANGDYILMADADMSTSLFEVDKFLPFMEKGVPVIIGTRKNKGAILIKKQPWYRQKMGEAYAFLASFFTGVNIKDFGCGFKMFSKTAARDIFSSAFINRWIFDTEILFLAKKNSYAFEEVGVSWKNDEDTRVNVISDSFSSFYDLIRIFTYHNGLRNFNFLFFVILLCALFYLPYLLHPGISLLDDPWYIHEAKNFRFSSLFSLITDHGSRLIPFTLLFYNIFYKLSDYSINIFIYLRFIELIVIVLLIHHILRQVKVKNLIAPILLIIFSGVLASNFYELETQDHISLLLLLIFTSLYFNIRKSSSTKFSWQFILSLLTLAFFLLTKETNIFIIGLFFIILFFDARMSAAKNILLINAGYILVCLSWLAVFYFQSSHTAGTLSAYSIGNIIKISLSYLKIFNFNLLLLILSLYYLAKEYKINKVVVKERSFYLLYFFTLTVFSIAVYLPWNTWAVRYALVSFVFNLIFVYYVFSFTRIKESLLIGIFILTFILNAYLFSFEAIRFYGSRQADDHILKYLMEHKNDYDQVCVQGSAGSFEDILELDTWLNKVNNLNKKVCSLMADNYLNEDLKKLLRNNNIIFGNFFKNFNKTIVLKKEYSFVTMIPIDDKYKFQEIDRMSFGIYDLHPTRGFEKKNFNWIIGNIR